MAVKKSPSVRWRPTADQVMILDELFRGGLRTPTAQQIQKMTSQLKEYGKVECKNVFYWFQNHKAREKQKLRKKLHHHQQHLQQHANNTLYYYLHPQYTFGFWPMLPARMMDGERVSLAESPEKEEASDAYSSWPVAGPESDSDHHQRMRRPLKTLQLFPTTTSSTAEAAASSSSMSSSFSLM